MITPIFEYTRCQKYFDNKINYNKHLVRKIPCKEVIKKNLDIDVNDKIESMEHIKMIPNVFQMETNGNQNNPNFQCIICNKIYQN